MAAKSPATSAAVDILTLEIYVDGKKIKDNYQVIAVETDKDVNRISRAKITFVDGDPSEETFEISEGKEFEPGNEIEIKAGYHNEAESIYKGIILEHGLKTGRGKSPALVVKCKDEAVKLTIGRKNRCFDKKKDSEVISTIIKEHGLKTKGAVAATKTQHSKVIQYDSTDWDFIMTRAEVNGYIVIPDDGEVFVGEPKISGTPKLVVTYGVDMIHFDGKIDAENQLPAITCNSWDMKTQKLLTDKSDKFTEPTQSNLKGDKLVDVIGLKEIEMHSSAPVEKADLKAWANGKMLQSRLSKIVGEVTFQGSHLAKVGELIELAGLGARFNGNAYVTGVKHEFSNNRWYTTTRFGLSPRWYQEDNQNLGALDAGGLLPPIHGLQNGVVKQIEKDPDGEHRILVEIPIIEAPGKGKGVWARLGHVYASSSVGYFFMPEVSDEVILGFINNDPRAPVILGMLYSSKIKPPYTADKKNNIKAIVTKSKMKIEFEDEKKIILIETPGGNKITLDDDKKTIILEDSNKNKVALDDKGITMTTNKDVKISAKGKILMDCKAGMELKCAGGDVKIEGINVAAKGKMGFKGEAPMVEVKGSATVDIQGSLVSIN